MSTQTFALLIGVSDYSQLDRSLERPQGSNDLVGADNDVEAMARLVRIMDVPASHIRVLSTPLASANDFPAVAMGRVPVAGPTSDQTQTAAGHGAAHTIPMEMSSATFGYATRREILDGLAWLSDCLEAYEGATGIVYFSGHSALTDQGHLCLCPADVTSGPRGPQVVDVTDADAVNSYLRRVSYLSALALAAGTDQVETLHALTEELRRQRDAHRGAAATELLMRSAEALDLPLHDEGVERFEGEVPVLRGPDAHVHLDWILDEAGLNQATIAADLHGDPFADASGYRQAVSFNKAFFQMLRNVRPDRAVHVFLDTCLDSHTGGELHWQYTGAPCPEPADGRQLCRTGIPQAHGNMVTMLSSLPGKPSYRAVFDDRWHGAFTWALATLLGRTPVQVTSSARAFAITYESLQSQIVQLLGWMNCAQTPEPWTGNWELWGQANVLGSTDTGAKVHHTLLPVRVKEEIDPGTGGHIFAVFRDNGTSWEQVAWLLITRYSFSALGKTWEASSDYWVIRSDLSGTVPSGDLELRPPDASGLGSKPTLADCVIGLISASTYNVGNPYRLQQGIFNSTPPPESKRSCNYKVKVDGTLKGSFKWEGGAAGQTWWAAATAQNPDTKNLFISLGTGVLDPDEVIPLKTIALEYQSTLWTAPSSFVGASCPKI